MKTTSNTTNTLNTIEAANEIIYDMNAVLPKDLQVAYRYVKGSPFIIYEIGNIDEPLVTVKNSGELLSTLKGMYELLIIVHNY